MKNYFKIYLFLLVAWMSSPGTSQTNSSKEKRILVTENIADVLFDTKSKSIRGQVKAFENSCGIKLQFRIEDRSLDELGGLSEHLFKLFQNFTLLNESHVKTINAEFSALKNNELSEFLVFQTKGTPDLTKCVLPLKDTDKLDSLYNKVLGTSFLGLVSTSQQVPGSLDELYSQSIGDYESILYKNSACPDLFNSSLYNEHVINTRTSRFGKWTQDANALSLNISTCYGLLTNNNPGPVNNTAAINLHINATALTGSYVINLNNSVNTCTWEDMEVRSRMLFAKTGIRYLYVTQDLDYFLPVDSLTNFINSATQTFTANTTDDIIIALYLRMYDAKANVSLGNLLVKQFNGTWLSNADINFAQYNSGGAYKVNTYYRYKNIFKNIPKPMILCYQVAKINGLLTTEYFNKGIHAKGSEQIYYHVFKIDKAFDEIKQYHESIKSIQTIANSESNVLGGNTTQLAAQLDAIDVLNNKIKLSYLKSLKNEEFKTITTYKEIYLQSKEITEAGALKYLKTNYGSLYKNNKIDEILNGMVLPADLETRSCKTADNSDVIADALNVMSLVLIPTGLDFIPDALAVAYYAATDQTFEMILSSASLLTPGSLLAVKQLANTTAEFISAVNHGAKMVKTGNTIEKILPDIIALLGVYKIDPTLVNSTLASKIRSNLPVVNELLSLNPANAKLLSNVSEKLPAAKRVEFLEKSIDEPVFLQKVKNDPDEVLKWAGVIETIRGIKKTDFIASVAEFGSNSELAEQTWILFKEQKWYQLENLFKNNGIKWPPNRGFVDIQINELQIGYEFDRYGGRIENGIFIDNGTFVSPKGTLFEDRALPSESILKPFKKYKVIKPIPQIKNGKAIPWFEQNGLGLQIELPETIDDLLKGGYIEFIL